VKGIKLFEDYSILSLSSPSLIPDPALFSVLYDLLQENKIKCPILQKSSFQGHISFVIPSAAIKKAKKVFLQSENIPSDWIDLKSRSVGIITIITDVTVRPHILLHISQTLQELNIPPLLISCGETGTSLSLLFDYTQIPSVYPKILAQLPQWNRDIGLLVSESSQEVLS
jgi:aspartokinase